MQKRVLYIAVGVVVTLGGYTGWRFLNNIRIYRETTKSEWIQMPSSFLTTTSGNSTAEQMRFFRINDEVMGGKSTSQLTLGDDKSSLVFSGMINTDGGGFASCRTLGDDIPLGLASGVGSVLLIDAVGDNMLYKVSLHTADSWSMRIPSWQHDFLATTNRTTYRLSLDDFVPSRTMGGLKKGAVLDGSQVTGIGFSLSLVTAYNEPNMEFGDGPFRLEVYSVKEVAKDVAQEPEGLRIAARNTP